MELGTARIASRDAMMTTGRTRNESVRPAVITTGPRFRRPRDRNASPRMPYTMDGTAARFWMMTSMNRLYQASVSANSSM